MMPTTDERREIAARLREHAERLYEGFDPMALIGCIGIDVNSEPFFDGRRKYPDLVAFETWNRLADLIEPEERARRPIMHGNEYGLHDIHCGDCYSLMLIQRDGTEEWPTYCCQCGTRVEVG